MQVWNGSLGTGLYTPELSSDIDVTNVVLPDMEYYYGLRSFGDHRGSGVEKVVQEDKYEIVSHELKHFVGMLCNGNPSAVSLLWLPNKFYPFLSSAAKHMMDNRWLFSTQRFITATCHLIEDYTRKLRTSYEWRNDLEKLVGFGKREKEHIRSFGYSTKHAANALRLIRMLDEYMDTQQLNVHRISDQNELVSIKLGGLTYEDVAGYIQDEMNALAKKAVKLNGHQKNPDMDKVNKMCCDVVRLVYEEAKSTKDWLENMPLNTEVMQ